jgi:hypothetical protein
MPTIAIYDWSTVQMPTDLSPANILYDVQANDPREAAYSEELPSWTNQLYVFKGGGPQQIQIIDDDPLFEDDYVETGAPQLLTQNVVLNGVTYAAGSVVEAEFGLVDPNGVTLWVVRIDGQNVGFTAQEPYSTIPLGTYFQPTESRNGAAADSTDASSSSTAYRNVICFLADAPIDTPRGPVRAGRLRAGDVVLTRDNGAQPLLWTGRTRVVFRGRDDPRRPIRLSPGCLGVGRPLVEIAVSPQHRILLEEAGGIFAPARGLLPLPGVSVMRGRPEASYVHLLMARHEVLTGGGLPSESLFPGPMALAAMGPEALAGVEAALGPAGAEGYGPLARPCLTRRAAEGWARQRLRERVLPAAE